MMIADDNAGAKVPHNIGEWLQGRLRSVHVAVEQFVNDRVAKLILIPLDPITANPDGRPLLLRMNDALAPEVGVAWGIAMGEIDVPVSQANLVRHPAEVGTELVPVPTKCRLGHPTSRRWIQTP